MTGLTRRSFLSRWGAVSTGAVTAGFAGLRLLTRSEPIDAAEQAPGYGRLVRDRQRLLDLPSGFSYSIISRRGDEMDDGLLVPGRPDGMAAFPGPDGSTILVCNHELNPDQQGPFGRRLERLGRLKPDQLYDFGGGRTPGCGGTTTIVYDTRAQRVVRQFQSLAGTYRNCAGGPTPWGSWITCEETVQLKGQANGLVADQNHGYVFEVPARAEIGLADPVPLEAMGRFNHEAVAVDPHSGVVYLTEDREDGLLYRFIPHEPGTLRAGGRLQALTVTGQSGLVTNNWDGPTVPVGKTLAVEWIDMDGIDAPDDDLRERGFQAGAAQFTRGEGIWYGNDEVYFACTNGGQKEAGQIWRYVPSPVEGTSAESRQPGQLELFIEPDDTRLVENADNLTVAPWGDLVLCEDRSGRVVRMVGVTPRGGLYTLARSHLRTEFAGATFSPDRTTLFVNAQGRGFTLAITGPWKTPPAG